MFQAKVCFKVVSTQQKIREKDFIKGEQTIEKAPNFPETLFNTRASLSQNFNVIAFFVLELFRRLHNPKNLWRCPFIKRERTIEKTPNLQQILLNTRTSLSQNLIAVACFVLELLGFVLYIYTIFPCSFTEFNKKGTNSWKIIKLSENTFEHLDKLQSKFQCRSLFRFWVIRLCFWYMYYIFKLFFGI